MHKSLLKLVFNTILCASLMLGAATFTSCQDYDDDINNLESKVTALETAVNDLKTKINNGVWINNVTNTADGYTVALSDGTTLNIVNGTKGTTIEPNKTTGTWWIDGKDTNIPYECEDVNLPKLDDNGQLLIWDAAKEAYVETGLKANASYVVKQEGYYELHVAELKDGKYIEQVVKLPMTASISGLDLYVADGSALTDASTTTVTVKVSSTPLEDDVKFNGKEYAKGDILTTHVTKTNIIARANPLNAELDKYVLTFADSKGNEPFVVEATPHMTVDAYTFTKADDEETVNPGYYALSVKLNDSYTEEELEFDQEAAYIVKATNPATNDEVVSNFINLALGEEDYVNEIALDEENAPFNKTVTFQEIFGEQVAALNLADYYFELPQNQNAKAEELGVTVDVKNQTIIATKKVGSIDVRFNYLKLDGEAQEGALEDAEDEVIATITFKDAQEAAAPTFEWTIQQDDEDTEDVNELEVKQTVSKEFFKALQSESSELAIKYNKDVYLNGGEEPVAEAGDLVENADFVTLSATDKNDANGYPVYEVVATFASPETEVATYYETTYDAVLTHVDGNVTTEYAFQIIVKPADKFSLVAKRRDVYFNATNNAVTYGTPQEEGEYVEFDLTELYVSGTDFANMTFVEAEVEYVDPETEEETKDEPWLQEVEEGLASDILVKKYDNEEDAIQLGVYTTRDYKVEYVPFGNPNLNTVVVDAFDLTVKSEWYEGTMTPCAAKTIVNIENVELKPADITLKDVFGKAITTDLVVELSEAAQEYLVIDGDENLTMPAATANTDKVVIKVKNPEIVRQNDVTCDVTVEMTDPWNRIKTVTVQIVLKAYTPATTTPAN